MGWLGEDQGLKNRRSAKKGEMLHDRGKISTWRGKKKRAGEKLKKNSH